MAKAKVRPVEELSYEQAFEELEGLVERLESGDLPLEDSMALFERGQALAERCGKLLEQAELRLRQLVPDERGGFLEEDLEAEA
jgi:exodeoxyribonuclease VII small subunit